MRYRDPKFPKKTFFVGLSLFGLGLVGFVGMLLKKVLAGQGHHHYFAGFGYQFSYTETLWLVGVVLLFLLGVALYQWRADKEEQAFIRHLEQSRVKRQ